MLKVAQHENNPQANMIKKSVSKMVAKLRCFALICQNFWFKTKKGIAV